MSNTDTPLLEWVMGAAGALIFASLVGVTTWCALNGDDAPPLIVAEVRDVVATAQGHVVEVEAHNASDSSAAEATLTAQLRVGDQIVEAHTLTFDYLPRHSRRRGGLVFAQDPNLGQITLIAEAYTDP